MKKKPPFSWTQPCCAECWVGLKLKTGMKVVVAGTHDPFTFPAFCCFCRVEVPRETAYSIRVNPGAVPYPTVRKS